MKSKKFTYVLAVAAVILWGLILYRVFSPAAGDDDEALPSMVRQIHKEPYNDYAILKDTTRLLLNYKDPFASSEQADTPKFTDKKIMKGLAPADNAFNWSFIKYSGYIHNASSRKLVAVVSINGKTSMLAEGETADQVKLIRNLQDSIKVAFGGRITYIKMKSGAL
jgi:hypothetical protein